MAWEQRDSLETSLYCDSMILWTIRTFYKNREKYEELFGKDEYSHIKFVRLCTRKEVKDFLNEKFPEVRLPY